MRRALLICFCASQLLFSCLAEQDNPLMLGSCADKIKNQNEEGIDCGGVCGECVVIIPVVTPCKSDLRDNRITINGTHMTLTDDNYMGSQESEYFEILILKNIYEEIRIQIYGSLPTADTAYELTPWYDLGPGQASIKYTNFYVFNAFSGKLYLHYHKSNGWSFDICSTELAGNGFRYTFSGNILFD